VTDPTSWVPTPPPSAALPVPGWYPDPWGRSTWRWWDGLAWTWLVQPPEGGVGSLPTDRRFVGVPQPPRGRWGLGDVGIMFGIVAATVVAMIVLVVVLVAGSPDSVSNTAPLGVDLGATGNAWATIFSLVLPWIGLAGWPLLVARWKGPGWRSSYGFVARWSTLGWGVLGGVATLVAILAGTILVSVVVHSPADSAAGDAALDIKGVPVAFGVMVLLIAFGAPFVEELAFRGLFWGAMVKRWDNPWVATVVTGVVFGIFHFEPVRLLGLAMGGIVLGIVRHKAGLAASMVSHSFLNSIAALGLLLS